MDQTEKKYKISVALTSFNGAKYLADQLESLLAQTRRPDEVIVSDDASDDDSVKIAEQFRKRFPEIFRISVNPERLGATKNFECALKLTTGDIILFSDQDDIWLRDKIEKLAAPIENSPIPVGTMCDSLIVDAELRTAGTTHWMNRGFSENWTEHQEQYLPLFLKRVPAAGHDMAFHADFKKVLLPFPDLADSYDTWVGLVLAALNAWIGIPEKLTLFRQHGDNLSLSGVKMNWTKQWKEAKRSIQINTFAWNARMFHTVRERLADRLLSESTELLQDREAHSHVRAAMNRNLPYRLPLILGEIFDGRYFRYARGWKSIVQDLLLRTGDEKPCGK